MSTDPDKEMAREITDKHYPGITIGFNVGQLTMDIAQALHSVRQAENEAIAQFVDSPEFYIKPREQRATAIRNRMKEAK